ncbi:MAG: hypothetical protein M1136_00945 [Chloroflexi bacterium]|nr:hypothetical protein [Chloroflexota bacterium]
MATLTTLRSDLRIDLKDQLSERWSDSELDRHIARAVAEYQAACPQVSSVSKPATASRWYDLSAETGFIHCESVEYPIDEYPPEFRSFREYNKQVYIWGDAPTVGENIKFRYAKSHVVDAAGSTIPTIHEQLLLLGASAYATLEWANYAINRVNAYDDTPGQYREWGNERLAEFKAELKRIAAIRAGVSLPMLSWELSE